MPKNRYSANKNPLQTDQVFGGSERVSILMQGIEHHLRSWHMRLIDLNGHSFVLSTLRATIAHIDDLN